MRNTRRGTHSLHPSKRVVFVRLLTNSIGPRMVFRKTVMTIQLRTSYNWKTPNHCPYRMYWRWNSGCGVINDVPVSRRSLLGRERDRDRFCVIFIEQTFYFDSFFLSSHSLTHLTLLIDGGFQYCAVWKMSRKFIKILLGFYHSGMECVSLATVRDDITDDFPLTLRFNASLTETTNRNGQSGGIRGWRNGNSLKPSEIWMFFRLYAGLRLA